MRAKIHQRKSGSLYRSMRTQIDRLRGKYISEREHGEEEHCQSFMGYLGGGPVLILRACIHHGLQPIRLPPSAFIDKISEFGTIPAFVQYDHGSRLRAASLLIRRGHQLTSTGFVAPSDQVSERSICIKFRFASDQPKETYSEKRLGPACMISPATKQSITNCIAALTSSGSEAI